MEMFKESFIQLFSNNPVIWMKWILVFLTMIISIIIRIKFKIDDKISPMYKLNKKVEKAREMNHVIEAKLIKKYIDFDDNNRRTYSGKYEYVVDGNTYHYTAIFYQEQIPPRTLYLYYDKSPNKVFTNVEYHYYALKGLPLIILNFSPLLIGAFMVWILGLA